MIRRHIFHSVASRIATEGLEIKRKEGGHRFFAFALLRKTLIFPQGAAFSNPNFPPRNPSSSRISCASCLPSADLMAAKPLTTEAVALTEKKMDMTLDDIIKMSKKTTTKEKKAPRRPTKSQGFLNGISSQRNNRVQHFMDSRASILNGISSQHSNRVQHFMDSRASIRQGVLAQRRSNFRGNQFPLTTNAARRAAVMPIRSMRVNWNKPRLAPATAQRKAADGGIAGKDTLVVPPKRRLQTLDARFADMKENRMRVMSSQQHALHDDNQQMAQRRRARQQQQKQVRGVRGGALPGRRPGYSVK